MIKDYLAAHDLDERQSLALPADVNERLNHELMVLETADQEKQKFQNKHPVLSQVGPLDEPNNFLEKYKHALAQVASKNSPPRNINNTAKGFQFDGAEAAPWEER